MFEALCVRAERVRLRVHYGDEGWSSSFELKADQARRLAAELIVAAERAERLESDQRAPG